ncbi:MAG: division/cell wall cluster transcriptional repressor MraZ [Chloroflexi bacterium]|nr:division/cell wall cluster transcriptional repressor MraZ [Chloroflexota bacterium]MCL5110191.1 division/cell wall cluster transcriptional repressor MraZ [Chloroflexota bacterium]
MGQYDHTVDDKGRVAIPARFRTYFADGLVVTRGLERCLLVYTASDWASLAERIAKLPLTQSDARAFTRFLFSGAMDVQLDRQGRVVIPGYLREYANVKENVVIIGVNTRLEVWDQQSWQQTVSQAEEESALTAEHLAALGI